MGGQIPRVMFGLASNILSVAIQHEFVFEFARARLAADVALIDCGVTHLAVIDGRHGFTDLAARL